VSSSVGTQKKTESDSQGAKTFSPGVLGRGVKSAASCLGRTAATTDMGLSVSEPFPPPVPEVLWALVAAHRGLHLCLFYSKHDQDSKQGLIVVYSCTVEEIL